MDEPVERKSKDRSPNFPFISLRLALERAKAFYDEERKGSAPLSRAAVHWAYSPVSSGLLQTVSALKSYGLLTDEGSGEARRLKLTDLALRILLDARPDSVERRELLRRAALGPAVSKEVHANWSDCLPSLETLNHFLVLERGFSPSSGHKATKILYDNEELAELGRGKYLSSGESNGEDDESYEQSRVADRSPNRVPVPLSTENGELKHWGKDILDDLARTKIPPPLHGKHDPQPSFAENVAANSVLTEQVLAPDGSAIRIQFGAAPSEEMYEFLKDYIELRLKSMRRKSAATQTRTPTEIDVARESSDDASAGLRRAGDVDLA